MDSLRIENAAERDVPLILDFIRELAEYEKLLATVEVNEARIRQTIFGPEPRASVVLGFENNKPVAFAVFFYTYSTFVGLPGMYVEDIYVKPGARGQGIGRKLFSHLAKEAKEKGCWRIEWAVLDWNEPAILFYKNLGAVPMQEWLVYRLSGEALDRLAAE